MEAFVIFRYLHVVTMFFAVALAISGELVLRRVAQSREPAAIRVAVARTKPLSSISGGLFLLGAAFGVIAAITGQIDLLRPWLVMAYLAFVAAFAIGFTITDPWVARLERAVGASPADGPTEPLDAVVDDRRARVGTWGLQLLVAVLVFLMVVKPLG